MVLKTESAHAGEARSGCATSDKAGAQQQNLKKKADWPSGPVSLGRGSCAVQFREGLCTMVPTLAPQVLLNRSVTVLDTLCPHRSCNQPRNLKPPNPPRCSFGTAHMHMQSQ